MFLDIWMVATIAYIPNIMLNIKQQNRGLPNLLLDFLSTLGKSDGSFRFLNG